jgi:hypothetical protein
MMAIERDSRQLFSEASHRLLGRPGHGFHLAPAVALLAQNPAVEQLILNLLKRKTAAVGVFAHAMSA